VRTLVTGGAGFIGSHLTDALLQSGHGVTVVDDLSRGRREHVPAGADFRRLDISTAALEQAVAEVRPEVVFHEAAQIDVRESMRDPLRDARVNVLGTVNLLHACSRHGVRRVVFASSGGAIYGDTDVLPTPESQPCRPQSAYGTSKLAGESYGELFQRNTGPEFVALRYANVYGPRQDPHGEAGVVAIFATKLLAGEPCVINGDGRQTRDYVYVDDVVRANLCAMSTATPAAYNIGTGVETDVNELFGRLRRICGSELQPEHGDAKPGEQQRSRLSLSQAADGLGWSPQVSLDDGLSRTVDFFRRSGGSE
jgi:UDP-glucose 4-epimerase